MEKSLKQSGQYIPPMHAHEQMGSVCLLLTDKWRSQWIPFTIISSAFCSFMQILSKTNRVRFYVLQGFGLALSYTLQFFFWYKETWLALHYLLPLLPSFNIYNSRYKTLLYYYWNQSVNFETVVFCIGEIQNEMSGSDHSPDENFDFFFFFWD